jgi:hypothetical protein
LIEVQDVARAVEWAVEREDCDGDDFLVVNVGSDEWNYQLSELAEAVAAEVPGTDISIDLNSPPDQRSCRGDFSLFRSLAPSHQPRADLTGTIAALRDGLTAIHFNDPDFRNSRLVRLNVLADMEQRNLLSRSLEWIDKPSRAVSPTSTVLATSRSVAPVSAPPSPIDRAAPPV